MSSSNPFTLIRRIVTGHNSDGVSVVKSDERVSSHVRRFNPDSLENRTKAQSFQITLPYLEHGQVWSSESVPAKDNNLE